MTADELQARHRAKVRAQSGLEKARELPAGAIYSERKHQILTEIRQLETRIKDRAGRLNALLQARVTAAASDPTLSAAPRQIAERALTKLVRVWRIELPIV